MHLEAIAERKGWSLEELAERTIPSGGFDENGEQEFSYGSRVFKAKLQTDFKILINNADGKKIASLPKPRIDDNEEMAKEAKKDLSTAKKTIKTAITQTGTGIPSRIPFPRYLNSSGKL